MDSDQNLREHLLKLLQGGSAHATVSQATQGFPLDKINLKPGDLPYSAWDLLEHLRIAQRDILDFMVNPAYQELQWPQDYWPSQPGNAQKWQQSLADFARDFEEISRLAQDPKVPLFERIPQGSGQTYLREFLLVADHNAYHTGQLVMLRRLLDAWS